MVNYYYPFFALFLSATLSASNWFEDTWHNLCTAGKLIVSTTQTLCTSNPIEEIVIERYTPEELASRIQIPENFIFGASTSEHQTSQQCTPTCCSYARFAQQEGLMQPTQENGYTTDWWNNYKNYIDYAHNSLKMNALRFSIEWSLVQPEDATTYDQDALDHYADIFIYMIKKNMTPVVCFHHYTDPCWFIDCGGFECAKNYPYFVNYCTTVYEHIMNAVCEDEAVCHALEQLTDRPPLWVTYNSPEAYAFKTYLTGDLPQSALRKQKEKKIGLLYATRIIHNMMEVHALMYKAMKRVHAHYFSDIEEPVIGLLKNIYQIDPAQKTKQQQRDILISRTCCALISNMLNNTIYTFFRDQSGRYLDFIGLNYYSNRYMHKKEMLLETDPALTTANQNYRIYPQGLYRAIVEISTNIAEPNGIPIYITENGIGLSDSPEDMEKRNRFYQGYLYALLRAIEDGYDVRGYLTWTLVNNYEWQTPQVKYAPREDNRCYGICEVVDNGRSMRAKSDDHYYVRFLRALDNLQMI